MFKNHKKALEKAGYKVYNDKITSLKGDVVAFIDPYGSLDTKDDQVRAILSEKPKVRKSTTKKKVRARDESGTFIADDPTTPEVNEAWVEEE